MDTQYIRTNAQCIGSGEPLGQVGIEICHARNIDPFSIINGMNAYQNVLLETVLLDEARRQWIQRWPE